jgi:hypothetical protein
VIGISKIVGLAFCECDGKPIRKIDGSIDPGIKLNQAGSLGRALSNNN